MAPLLQDSVLDVELHIIRIKKFIFENKRANKFLVILFAVLIFLVTTYMNMKYNAYRYDRSADFDDRLLLTYNALTLFNPSRADAIAKDTIPLVMEKYADTERNKRRTALLAKGFSLNYFLPLSVTAASMHTARCLGSAEPESLSWWLIIGFTGYFVLGVFFFLWALTRTKNWVVVFLTLISVLPYSLYKVFPRLMKLMDYLVGVDFKWVYYDRYAPWGGLTLFLLVAVILISKRELQRFVIPISTIITFWHCGQSSSVNGLLLIILLLSSVISTLSKLPSGIFKIPLHFLRDLLPPPNRKLAISITVNMIIGLAYLNFHYYNLKYVVANHQSSLPDNTAAYLIQYLIYICIYCKIIVEIAISFKLDAGCESEKSLGLVDVTYFYRILFVCFIAFMSLAILILFSKYTSFFTTFFSAHVIKRMLIRHASTMSQTVIFGVFLLVFLLLLGLYKTLNKYGKAILVVATIAGICLLSSHSCAYFLKYRDSVFSSHKNLTSTLQRLDLASQNNGLNVQQEDVFYWTVIKQNFFLGERSRTHPEMKKRGDL
jgi:hypothetical protein